LPLQKLAVGFIARSEDTIIDWRKADADFADRVTKAESGRALSNRARSKARNARDTKFLLERSLQEGFAQEVERESNQRASSSLTYVLPPDQHPSVGLPRCYGSSANSVQGVE